MERRHPGRPMKYRHFLEALEDGKLYTPATIVKLGEARGFFADLDAGTDARKAKTRVRIALSRFSLNHGFPVEGDGQIFLNGQCPLRGWTGRRWKDALPPVRTGQ